MGFLKKEKVKLLLAILLLLMIPIAHAGSQTVGSVTINPSPIDLNLDSTKTVECSAAISDSNGWENISISNVSAVFWDALDCNESSENNGSNHYTNTSCSLGDNTSSTERPVTCSFPLQYYANPSQWTCKINSYNATNDAASNSDNANVKSLIALDVVESEVDFGTLALGNTSSDDVRTTVRNVGNVKIDANMSGTAFTCSSGVISPEAIRYSSSSGQSYSSMTELTVDETTLDLNVAKSTGEDSSKYVYWKIKLPESGVGGFCSNAITFSAAEG
jgi:hypothetical protein